MGALNLSQVCFRQVFFSHHVHYVRGCSTETVPFYKKMFRRKQSKEVEEEQDQSALAIKAEEQMIRDAEIEEREALIKKASNKSRLHYSDRRIMGGQHPQLGVLWDKGPQDADPKYKAKLLAKYGKITKIDPSLAWPNSDQIALDKEYEQVLYDGMTLPQMIETEKLRVEQETEEVVLREKEIDEKFEKMSVELEQWKKRIVARNNAAERERQKKQTILAQLREEFGYDINENDPQFAEKIAEKEKEFSKALKEQKKQKMKEAKKS